MDIDKRNGEVCYNDENHTYWDENGKYISVTDHVTGLNEL